jgi:hypothetical protein
MLCAEGLPRHPFSGGPTLGQPKPIQIDLDQKRLLRCSSIPPCGRERIFCWKIANRKGRSDVEAFWASSGFFLDGDRSSDRPNPKNSDRSMFSWGCSFPSQPPQEQHRCRNDRKTDHDESYSNENFLLQGLAVAKIANMRHLRDFRSTAISEFFNTIDPKRTLRCGAGLLLALSRSRSRSSPLRSSSPFRG